MSSVPQLHSAPTPASNVAQALEAFRVHALTFERLLPRTVATYVWHLRHMLTALPARALVGQIEPAELRWWLQREEDRGIAASTLRLQCFALSAYYRWLTHTGNPAASPLAHVSPPRRAAVERSAYTAAEADAILGRARDTALAAGATRREHFDFAVLSTLRYTGVRRTEVIALETRHLDLAQRRLRVLGKGRKVRTVPVPEVYADIMRWYLTGVRPYLPPSEMLFANPRSQLAGDNRGATGEKSIERITHRAGNLADVPGPHHPHRWRHTYATHLLRQGVDIHMVQKLLGHANLNTTVIYLHLMVDDLAAAVTKAFD